MSFEHWNRFVESFQAGRAGRDRAGDLPKRPTGSGRRSTASPPQTRHKERLEAHGKEEQSRKDQDYIFTDDPPGNPAAS